MVQSYIPLNQNDSRTLSNAYYKTAEYKFADAPPVKSTFVAKVLAEKEHINKFYLIGTPQSIWENVYDSFSGPSNNVDIATEIYDHCSKADRNSPLSIPHKDDIEAVLGNGSKVILVHYGLNEKEIKDNIENVLGIVNDVEIGDEIIVDITHSFRSLPLIIMTLLFYLKTVYNPKVNISHIYYGMLEVSKELGYAPIVDLKQVLEVTDWTLGAYSFHEFGISRQICKLIKDKSLSSTLERFSSLLSLNYFGPLQNEAQKLSGLKNYKYDSLIDSMTVKPVVDDFIKAFGNSTEPYIFQYRLAKWQYDRFNLLASMTTLLEATITYACERNKDRRTESGKKIHWQDMESREYCKNILRNKKQNGSFKIEDSMIEIYKAINSKRNNLVHQTGKSNSSVDEYVKSIKDNLKAFGKVISEAK